MNGLEKLIGQYIYEIYQDDYRIVFRYGDNQWLEMNAEGGCCSSSWIENVEIIPGAVGSKVVSFTDNYTDTIDSPDHECLQSYQTVISTAHGSISIEYRNSSNGYYGGSLEEAKLGDRLPPLLAKAEDPERLLKELL